MTADERALGAGVSAYLRASVTLARETVRIGPFLASFSSADPIRFLNYAIPDDGAVPTSADVAALTDAYHQRGRLPRLEYVPPAAPAVEAVLVAAGWGVEGRLPLMVLPASTPVDGEPPSGIELVAPASAADLQATVAAQNEAYGEGPPGPDGGAGIGRTIEHGGRVVLARVTDGGEAVGGGLFSKPQDGVTEISAIGVRAPFRRRGIATGMVRWLAREARLVGATTVFLMAESAIEEGIYARIGFETVGEMLHISRAPGPASPGRD